MFDYCPNITGKACNALGGNIGFWKNDFNGALWHNTEMVEIHSPYVETTGSTIGRLNDIYVRFEAKKSNYLYKTTDTNQPSSVRILSVVRT